jgi:hypothetical protein
VKTNPRRAELVALSASIRPLVTMGVFETVNEGIRAHYERETGQSDWNTFKGWIDAGRPVRKGETGFPVWGTPRRIKGEAAGDANGIVALGALIGAEPQGPEFFPVAYLFHAGQVQAAQLEELAE